MRSIGKPGDMQRTAQQGWRVHYDAGPSGDAVLAADAMLERIETTLRDMVCR